MRHEQPEQYSSRRDRDYQQRHQRQLGRFDEGARFRDDQRDFGREYRGFDDEFDEGAHTEFDRRRREERDRAGFDEQAWASPQQFQPEGSWRSRENERNRFGREAARGSRSGSEEIFGHERGEGYSGSERPQYGSPTEGWSGSRGRRENQSDYSSFQGEERGMGSRFGGEGQYGRGGLYGSEGSFGAGAPWSGAGAYGGSSQQGASPWRSSVEHSFRGKGPKGFTRSDERLKEVICESLTDDDAIDASEISVDVKDGKVTLSGTVGERRQKYLIDECVEEMGGVKEVDNQLRVRKEEQAHSATPGSQYGQTGQTPGQQRSGNSGNEPTKHM